MMDSDEYYTACDGDHPLTVLLERARLPKGNVFCAPSTGLERSTRYQNAVQRFAERHTGFPLGLRVDLSATESSGFRSRSEEHTSELQSLMRISYAVFCLKKKNTSHRNTYT